MELGKEQNSRSLLLQAFLPIFLWSLLIGLCSAVDSITITQAIKDPETIVSNGQTFKLGFFSPPGNSDRYLGIIYNLPPVMAVVWVANRDNPLNDSSGIMAISEDGNLVLFNGQNNIIWSSNISNSARNSSAQLLDTGNLVLRDDQTGGIIWESFQNPTDSFLKRMRLGAKLNSTEKTLLRSWRNPSNPSIGNFSGGIEYLNVPEFFIWNGSVPFWRSGPWNGQVFIGVFGMGSGYRDRFEAGNDSEGNPFMTFTYENESIMAYLFLNSTGSLQQKVWYNGIEDWMITWASLESECDIYGKCGPFGICNPQKSPICTCLRGFKPKSEEEWSKGNWTSGCTRKKELQCEQNISGNEQEKQDGFLKLQAVKVPASPELYPALEDTCGSECLRKCSCIAYANYIGLGCMHWSESLIDMQSFPTLTAKSVNPNERNPGADLYIRLASSELDKKKDVKKVAIAVSVILGSVMIFISAYFSWKSFIKSKGLKNKDEKLIRSRDYNQESSTGDSPKANIAQVQFDDMLVLKFDMLAKATNKFHSANKLGQGGFGPVYKGELPDGREIAVKRLSRSSNQGLEEFMNEVAVISKLQHRNLVRLLGCCVEEEEKMLIYEFMPNRSLDAFLFDSSKQKYLDWNKRADIIEGIGRGLLYLHRDSRLRIIHRDLKASNILLDEHLNPKISDFGMARIFGGNQDQGDTKRVVGTYGYMAPEYAMEGRFSEKSDVYSFGVLILEIVSGRRSTSLYYEDEDAMNLLGYAWKLWKEDEIIKLVDPTIYEPFLKAGILRFMIVGLLCVQESVRDRPKISGILSMLSNEIAVLPHPKTPGFTRREVSSEENSQQCNSARSFTITTIEGR